MQKEKTGTVIGLGTCSTRLALLSWGVGGGLLEIHRFEHCTNPPGDVSVQRREMMGTSLNRWTSTQYAMCSLIQIDQHITRVP